MRGGIVIGSLSASLALTLVPLPVRAGQLYAVQDAAPAADPNLAEAQRLYREGEIAFQTAEYERALALWKQAYGLLAQTEANRAIRYALVYNIAEAHRRAYEVTRNPAHLRKARILLDNHRIEHRSVHGDTPEAIAQRTEADNRIAELDRMIAESEARGEQAVAIVDPTAPAQPQAKPISAKKQWELEVRADPELGPAWKKASNQVNGGVVLLAIGGTLTFASLGTFYAASNEVAIERTEGLIAGGVLLGIGAGLIIPGAILLARGVKGRKQVLEAKPRPTGMLLPYAGKRQAGVGFVLRF